VFRIFYMLDLHPKVKAFPENETLRFADMYLFQQSITFFFAFMVKVISLKSVLTIIPILYIF